ncbi:MAG: beta-N-acetylhexosaminidase [Bacteroidota bacterium]|nr:MAG: beta-N-acetylhexosaminidase [Bacteroidota bacterium]HNR72603.1 beta-N-acetylhexosaminidase [Cyclobacteriaceae bacterium]HNU41004.1 beta-N-acetylhexosaminidase [Cyclobacteriaceae bacterium]
MMKALFRPTLIFSLVVFLVSCKNTPPTNLATESLIPKPVSVTATGKAFELSASTVLVLNDEYKMLGDSISAAAGVSLKFEKEGTYKSAIYLKIDSALAELGREGYELTIEPASITVKAIDRAGLFYGTQTLIQLLTRPRVENNLLIPTGTIRDFPNYSWRGSMLDVSRHFFSVADVKRYIDLISHYKMNVLHLHLTDDQGWRIEIKSWPNLAVHGGTTQVGGGKGGYYTQEDYKSIVAHAAQRNVVIVPEIDMPSHINSALAAYGSINNPDTKFPKDGAYAGPVETRGIMDGNNKPTNLYTGMDVGWSTLSLARPSTLQFVNDVIRELAEITPGPYFHIGGDEAHVTKKEDYIKFINHFSEIVKANNKQMIGWEEISQANIDGNSIAQHWASEEHAKAAAAKGAKIIMSPSKKVYLDMQYDSTTRIGLHWAAYIEVDDCYNWDPATRVQGITRDNIMGIEAPVWTETIENMADIEYMAFPRLIGVAEIGWTPTEARTWDEYKVRLGKHAPHLQKLGIDFYRSPKVNWE